MFYLKSTILLVSAVILRFVGHTQSPMTPEKLWEIARLGEYVFHPSESQVYYTATVYQADSNRGESYIAYTDLKGTENKILPDMAGSEYNLCFIPGTTRLFFMNKGKGFHCAQDGSDLREFKGMDNMENIRFSRDGKMIAFSREVKVFSEISDRHPQLPMAEARIYDDLMFRHWNQWSDAYVNHIFYAPVSDNKISGNPVDIMEGMPWDCPLKPFGGIEDFIWGPDNQSIIYVCKKSNGVRYARSTNSDIFEYRLETKQTRNLTAQNPGYDKAPDLSPDGKFLVYLSMARDGYESDQNRITLRNMVTDTAYDWLPGFEETIDEVCWSADGKSIIAVLPTNGTQQIIRMTFDPKKGYGEKPTDLTAGDYNFGHPVAGKNGVLASRTDMNRAAELYFLMPSKKTTQKLTTLNDELFNKTKSSKVERRFVQTTDGKKMLVWVIYPPDFDPAKKYPALLYCQGGPQSQVSQFYSYRWNFQLMAARGYIIIAPNRRGLPGFGAPWNEAISKDWGGQAMRDYLSAADALSAEPFIDAARIGAIGASYGGYSVYYLAGIHKKRFKTFIAHCGLFNLESWYGSTEELFFADWDVGGPYFADPIPKSYLEFSPHKLVKNWNTPIMVIHGGRDYRVPDTQGMEAFTAARVQGITARFLYFPNEGHWVLKPQNGLLWHHEFFKWLQETL
jgi:dipeptidyl aminopeptidase/acylaminoacyl peptidase